MAVNARLFFMLVLLSVGMVSYAQSPPAAVTYEFSGGRLGDNLITYLHAKWISYEYGAELLYKPFPMSSIFALHNEETLYAGKQLGHFKKRFLGRGYKIEPFPSRLNLYVVPYFPESACERVHFRDGHGEFFPYFEVNWKDPGFRQLALRMLQTTPQPVLCKCPKDVCTVAVHVRTGGGFDDADMVLKQPIKVPPESFYLEQLSTICEMLGDRPIYFHVFTDDANPSGIVEKFRNHLNNKTVEFFCREKDNHYNANVIDDLFSMMQFDCLIRPESSFSILASLLKDYEILIHPADFVFIKNYPYINKVSIVTNSSYKKETD